MADTPDFKKAINDSGFPLQIGLRHLVETHSDNWTVLLNEHPWLDRRKGEDKFLDMVLLSRHRDAPIETIMAVECKRARETQWIFLRSNEDAQNNDRRLLRARITALKTNGQCTINDWCDVTPIPGSPMTEYCVMRKNNQYCQELLEKTASEVVRATEAIALQDLQANQHKSKKLSRVYIPVIVTTAQLYVCDFASSNVNVEIGEVNKLNYQSVSLVRFTKSLIAPECKTNVHMLEGGISKAMERSVVVIHASYFINILNNWDLNMNRELLSEMIED